MSCGFCRKSPSSEVDQRVLSEGRAVLISWLGEGPSSDLRAGVRVVYPAVPQIESCMSWLQPTLPEVHM